MWILSEKIFYEEDKRKILYEAKETHWIYWKDITIQRAALNHGNSPESSAQLSVTWY